MELDVAYNEIFDKMFDQFDKRRFYVLRRKMFIKFDNQINSIFINIKYELYK